MAALILIIVMQDKAAVLLGSVLGGITAAGLLWHMYHHLDIALDMDPKHAGRHVQIAAFQRIGIMAVVLAASMYFYRYIHPIGTVLGMFGLKISAFLQPTIHRFRQKRGSGCGDNK